ncbi:glycosyltransferase family 4 protein [Leptolyngbya cf. ectocarpi LEGE 11479]|uniref:Glycosyltransferase family 4 protein n=1 Tax=Leptolyngbya cf. ectocarpi LEGE 11479 TaxID=1828722 RepID=A0A928ZZL8_LEPEC|nr:glycosyltransferase family 4 protein [Leptolyngbya ectocarpi]MBE9070395.1 glycosyltransferase family 4 protein [Leptolyngbya cf. ectocarpi LEGE 11479]
MDLQNLRLLFVQATEPYRDGMANGTLTAEQLTMLEGLTTWGFQLQEVGILGCVSDQPYDVILETGVRVIGSGLTETNESISKRFADFCPTHMVFDVPDAALFRWAIRKQVSCIGMFRDVLTEPGLKQRWDNYQLSKILNHKGVDWVGSLGTDNCEALAQIGVLRDKLIPWDWPPSNRAETFEPKQLPTDKSVRSHSNPLQLLYAGPLLSTRGIGDLLIATAQLKAQGYTVQLKLIGQGDIQRFETQAKRLQLDHIEFIETIPDHSLVHLIRQADIFVMPSRHESPENSNAILNTCLQAHTPIIASDHPMFSGSLNHGTNAMIYPAGNARALSQSIDYLIHHPEAYNNLSSASQTTWQSLQLPVHWISLLDHWIQGTSDDHQWIQQYALTASLYQRQSRLLPSSP